MTLFYPTEKFKTKWAVLASVARLFWTPKSPPFRLPAVQSHTIKTVLWRARKGIEKVDQAACIK